MPPRKSLRRRKPLKPAPPPPLAPLRVLPKTRYTPTPAPMRAPTPSSPPPPPPPTHTFPFLSLPAELRNMVYEHSFPTQVRECPARPGDSPCTLQATGLTRTCRQLATEAAPVLRRSRIAQMRLLNRDCEARFAAFVRDPAFAPPTTLNLNLHADSVLVASLQSFSVDAYLGAILSPYFMRFARYVVEFLAPVPRSAPSSPSSSSSGSGSASSSSSSSSSSSLGFHPPEVRFSEPMSGDLMVHKSRIVRRNAANADFLPPEAHLPQVLRTRTWGPTFCVEDLVWLVRAVSTYADFALAEIPPAELDAFWADVCDVREGEEEMGEWILGSRFVERKEEGWDGDDQGGWERIDTL